MNGPNRRTVLCGLTVGLLAPGALAACGTGSQTTGAYHPAKSGTKVTTVAAVPVGGGILANLGEAGVLLVVQPKPGEIRAYNPTCPHAGATVNPPQGGIITCPAHGSQFNPATGAVVHGPAATGLTAVAVRVAGQDVLIA
jgi:cytochrome b6-f complex iron-sulfur subunit